VRVGSQADGGGTLLDGLEGILNLEWTDRGGGQPQA